MPLSYPCLINRFSPRHLAKTIKLSDNNPEYIHVSVSKQRERISHGSKLEKRNQLNISMA